MEFGVQCVKFWPCPTQNFEEFPHWGETNETACGRMLQGNEETFMMRT